MGSLRAGIKARLFADAPDTAEPEAKPGTVAARGAGHLDPVRIGRYVVIKRIGAGGMGLVYAAYDDKLDRKVAVKLLRPGHARVSAFARQRLLREAQAIARLSHRSVVQVYEVGTHDDEVFIAMEYVEGSTLKQWQPSRDWREILARYRDAGHGLCAAHGAGIVHRDFKADNVLVRASDLAVRVVDFGLARTDGSIAGAVQTDDGGEAADVTGALASSLTHSGVVMGTPAYMAPEQHAARETDARTDQFSFCASLFEALYGYRAFAGEHLDELRANVLGGKVEPAPRYTAVPPEVHRVLARGLCVDPAQRYPTMEALLAALRLPAPARPWRRVAWAIALTAAAVGGWVAWSNVQDEPLIAESVEVRVGFDAARRSTAQEELDRLRTRTTAQRWNDLVIDYALDSPSPSAALASLAHLSPDEPDWIPVARSIAADAMRQGPVFATLHTPAAATRLTFAPDSDHLAAVTDAGDVIRWTVTDPSSAEHLHFTDDAIDAAFHDDGTLRVILRGGVVATLPAGAASPSLRREDAGELTRIATDGGARWAVGTGDGVVILHGPKETQTLREHAAPISALAFAPDEPTLASGDTSGRVALWFLDRQTHRTAGTDQAIEALTWVQPEGFIVAQIERGLTAWDGDKGTPVDSPFPSDAKRVSAAGDVRLQRAEAGPLSVSGLVLEDSRGLGPLALSDRGTWVAASHGRRLRAWRVGAEPDGLRAAGDLRVMLPEGTEVVSVHAYDARVWAVSAAGSVFAIDDGGRPERVATLGRPIHGVSPSTRGDRLALETPAGEVSLLDLDDPPSQVELAQVSDPQPGPMRWSSDDTVLVKLGCGADVRACDLSMHPTDGGPASVLGKTDGRPVAMHVSQGGAAIALDHGGHVTLWRPAANLRQRYAPQQRRLPLAAAITEDGALRIATYSPGAGAPALYVEQVDDGGDLHRLFEEDGLQRVLATAQRDAVVVVTAEGRALLWPLRADHFLQLPDDVLEGLAAPELHGSPSGAQLWAAELGAPEATLLDVDHGYRQTLPRPRQKRAWRSTGGWVDVVGPNELRLWDHAIPRRPDAFLRWLRSRTLVELPLDALREPMSGRSLPL